jgi:tetratricopeptide (TPR) repeat protein
MTAITGRKTSALCKVATTTLLLAVLPVVKAMPAFAADTPNPLSQAQQLYQKGDAASALQVLEPMLRANPADAGAHYLKANCLVVLKRPAEAFNEYSLAERLSPRSSFAPYCRSARQQLERILKETPADQADEAPQQSTSLPPGTLELIRKQAELARDRAVENGKAEAENELVKASNQAKTLQERAERQAAEVAAGRNHGGEPSVLTPSDQLDALRAQAAANGERLKQIGKLKADFKEQESQAKADEIERQSEGLQDQLLHRHRSRNQEIELNPVGTNLYVRNYSSVPPSVAPLQAQAKSMEKKDINAIKNTSASLSTTGIRSGVKTSTTATSSSPTSKVSGQGQLETRTITTVKGRVLPHQSN